jgi:glycosyltransferase involved in cell wall biosynthesis
MKPSLISCIVPVFNGERYLSETLDSIVAQTHRPLEIVVVNDGSTDDTASVAANYREEMRYLWQPRAGPAAARNRGLRAAQGEFIAFLDADDLWHPKKLERQLVRFEARPELDYCVTHCQNFWVPELKHEQEKFRDHRVSKPLPGYVTQSLFARRKLFETVGPFNAALKHGDSTEWFLRATEHKAIGELLPDVLLYRRLHQNNRSRLAATVSRDEFLKIVKTSLDRRRHIDGLS